MDQKREKYHRVRSNYETMRNMAERYDGYGFGIKKVMEQQAVTSGIIGAVADIIKVEENTKQRSRQLWVEVFRTL